MDKIKFILDLRKVRNACRQFMTRDQRKIGLLRQFIWYFTVLRPRVKKGLMKWLLWYNHEGEPIGYGLLSKERGREWISGGFIPEYRGIGEGRELFMTLIDECEKSPYLEVLKFNKPAIRLYKKLGFKTIKENDHILIMKYE